MKKLPLILTLLAGSLVWGQQNQSEEKSEEKAWRDALGSVDFQKRYEASMEMWTAGRSILPFLETLSAGGDPEIAARARGLVLKIRSGLTPDTPEEIVEKVNRYLSENATERSKVAVLEELRALEEYGFIFKLRNLETNERVIDRADMIVERVLPQAIRKLASEGDFEEVKELLALGKDFATMIAFANLADQLGTLDEEIETLRESQSSEGQARYLACLRVKGDAELLRKEAGRLGDKKAEATASLALGDYGPYFEFLLKNNDQSLSSRYYLQWSLAKLRGDLKKADEIKNSLLHLCKDKSEVDDARTWLYRMGFRDEVFAGYTRDETLEKYSYFISQEAYQEILPLFGLPEGKLTDEWLKKASSDYLGALARERGDEGWSHIMLVANFLEGRGEVDESVRCLASVVEGLRAQERIKMTDWLAMAFRSIPVTTLKLLAKESENKDFDLSLAIQRLFNDSDSIEWLYDSLREVYPTAPVEELLMLTSSFGNFGSFSSGHVLFVSEEKFEEAQEKLIQLAIKSDDKVSGLRQLFRFASSRDCASDIEKLRGLLEDEGEEIPDWEKAVFAAAQMDFKKAGEYFSKVDTDGDDVNYQFIYEKGTALKRAELEGGDELRRQARLYGQGSSRELAQFANLNRKYGLNEQADELDYRAFLRLEFPEDDSSWRNSTLFDHLAVSAAKRGQWRQVVACREAQAWENRGGSPIYSLRARFQILIARGALAMEEGDVVAAVNRFTEAYSLIPNDGYLANEFFPLIRDLGLVELHDQLFAQSARNLREVIKKYPKDDNAYNNFSWMASRANRCLDEAEGYLKKALEIRPRSAAYLDTMGEIYFARRDRGEAIRWSDLSRNYEISDVELQEQNRRFKKGEFPAP